MGNRPQIPEFFFVVVSNLFSLFGTLFYKVRKKYMESVWKLLNRQTQRRFWWFFDNFLIFEITDYSSQATNFIFFWNREFHLKNSADSIWMEFYDQRCMHFACCLVLFIVVNYKIHGGKISIERNSVAYIWLRHMVPVPPKLKSTTTQRFVPKASFVSFCRQEITAVVSVFQNQVGARTLNLFN